MKEIIDNFQDKRILVIGDVMLDEFLIGDVTRINPEAPVPVLSVKKVFYSPGGAANVAANIISLGGKATLIGRVGNDDSKNIFLKEIEKLRINDEIIVDDSVTTTRKIRGLAKNQQLLRIDFEEIKPVEDETVDLIIKKIRKINPDLIVISDYAKGFITKKLMDEIKKIKIKLVCDLKPRNKDFFKDVFLIKPNLKEAEELSGLKGKSDTDVEIIGKKLVKEFNSNVLITRSENGMSLFERNGKIIHIPTKSLEIYDVTGAGDTVIAALSLCLSSGSTIEEAAMISNNAASIVVKKIGTATVNKSELIESLKEDDSKIKSLDEIKKIITNLKMKNKKIVFTNGCYDILHTGHISLLKEAKKQGDVLIVGLNTDDSVRKLKGNSRPVNNERDRAEIISSLQYVDFVVLFKENTPERIIGEIKPDVHVKGGDYESNDYKRMPEAKIVKSYGGRVHIVKFIDGKSTTNIIEKINDERFTK